MYQELLRPQTNHRHFNKSISKTKTHKAHKGNGTALGMRGSVGEHAIYILRVNTCKHIH